MAIKNVLKRKSYPRYQVFKLRNPQVSRYEVETDTLGSIGLDIRFDINNYGLLKDDEQEYVFNVLPASSQFFLERMLLDTLKDLTKEADEFDIYVTYKDDEIVKDLHVRHSVDDDESPIESLFAGCLYDDKGYLQLTYDLCEVYDIVDLLAPFVCNKLAQTGDEIRIYIGYQYKEEN